MTDPYTAEREGEGDSRERQGQERLICRFSDVKPS